MPARQGIKALGLQNARLEASRRRARRKEG
jgi:hypothetical protein